MTAFYNEHDPFAAQWLRNLIAAGHIAPGIVDERDIRDIEAWELQQYTQCHFFAGIGVWSHALRRAGWSDDRPIWTGSCPCQPFSNAGKQKGFDDARHLWPAWYNLIDQCRPPVIVGEQVASALDWLDLVFTDMERTGYAVGASDLCAAGFEGAHIRQRLYFTGLADSRVQSSERHTGSFLGAQTEVRGEGQSHGNITDRPTIGGVTGRLADDNGCGQQGPCRGGTAQEQRIAELRGIGRLADDQGVGRLRGPNDRDEGRRECASGPARQVDTDAARANAPMLGRNAADWLYCRDGKWRPVEPGTFPLVDAAPSRVGRLRAYGNALDAETATVFCTTVREICDGV